MQFDVKELLHDDLVQYTTEDERWYRRDKISFPSVSWISSYYPKGKQFEHFLKSKGDEADDVRDLAADRGSKIHQAIDQLLSTGKLSHDDKFLNTFKDRLEELSADEYWAILTFIEFCKEYQPKFILNEKVVVHEAFVYAGTLDILCQIGDDLWLLDIKTGKNVYMSHRIQLSAYKQCMPDDMIAHLKLGILQVGYGRTKKGWKLTEIDDEFEMFQHAYAIWKRENPNEKVFQVTYPQHINMEDVWQHGQQKGAEQTSSVSPAGSSSEKSTGKKSSSTRTRATSKASGGSRTSTKEKKVTKSKSSSRTKKKPSKSNSPKKRGTQSDFFSESDKLTSPKKSPSE